MVDYYFYLNDEISGEIGFLLFKKTQKKIQNILIFCGDDSASAIIHKWQIDVN